MNFQLHVDIECNIYITLGRTRGLNVSFKLHVAVPSTQPPTMKSYTQALVLVVQMRRRRNQRCKYKSVVSANSNNSFRYPLEFFEESPGAA